MKDRIQTQRNAWGRVPPPPPSQEEQHNKVVEGYEQLREDLYFIAETLIRHQSKDCNPREVLKAWLTDIEAKRERMRKDSLASPMPTF